MSPCLWGAEKSNFFTSTAKFPITNLPCQQQKFLLCWAFIFTAWSTLTYILDDWFFSILIQTFTFNSFSFQDWILYQVFSHLSSISEGHEHVLHRSPSPGSGINQGPWIAFGNPSLHLSWGAATATQNQWMRMARILSQPVPGKPKISLTADS